MNDLTMDRHELLWHPCVGARIARPHISDTREAVKKAIENIPHIYKSVTVDKYVIMPDHIHLILIIGDVHGRAMRAPTVSTVINQNHGPAIRPAPAGFQGGRL
jgi:REP element-mobilizing transposase RayT